MKKFLTATSAVISLLVAAAANASPIDFKVTADIDLENSGLTDFGKQLFTVTFNSAADYWSENITGRLERTEQEEAFGEQIGDPGFVVTELIANVTIAEIDGPGGILGFAGPTFGGFSPNYVYSFEGDSTFDAADAVDLFLFNNPDLNPLRNLLFQVAVHEIGHIIGYGTLWNLNGLTDCTNDNLSDSYTGIHANTKYQEDYGTTDPVPVETDGGPGTACGHFDEETFLGGSNDIMTGFLNAENNVMTDTTLYSFRDLGYTTRDTALSIEDFIAAREEIPVPAAAFLFAGGMIAVFRKKKAA